MIPLKTGSMIGILGGGQLGRLLARAAGELGFKTTIFSPEADPPTSQYANHTIQADYLNDIALKDFAEQCDIISYEFENVPVLTLEKLNLFGAVISPNLKALQTAQNRLQEKYFFNSLNIPTVPFHAIHDIKKLAPALDALGGRGILKTCEQGYDGKGQYRLNNAEQINSLALDITKTGDFILEGFADFLCEISIIIARHPSGECQIFEPSRNIHKNGILHQSIAPAGISESLKLKAENYGKAIAHALDYIGVLAIEFFVMKNGELLANEMAPRIHNSGHWTAYACQTSQFEQHIRAITGWPLGEPKRQFDAAMTNLIGDDVYRIQELAQSGAHICLYGKTDVRPGRKMGHYVRLSSKTD